MTDRRANEFENEVKKAALRRQGGVCAFCGVEITTPFSKGDFPGEAHHLKPILHNGKGTLENCVYLCWAHHQHIGHGKAVFGIEKPGGSSSTWVQLSKDSFPFWRWTNYRGIDRILNQMTPFNSDKIFEKKVVPTLIDIWIAHYQVSAGGSDIVETRLDNFSYLFDVANSRLIAAWGISQGKHTDPRDKNRMKGHPLSDGENFHRGHAIPHSLGGTTDINLVPQLGSVNIGPFRALEKQAVATPGSLYFTYWIYERPTDQKPRSVEQGLLIPGRNADIRKHSN